MQRAAQLIRPYLGTKAFYQSALSVMIPVAVQQLINNLFNTVDNVMVGSLDVEGLAMSACTVANRPYLIFFGVFFGLAGAGGLMISQYFGAGDRKTCQGLFSLQMLLGLGDALLFCLVLFFFPAQVMRIFVTDERTIALGIQYLRVICFSYLPVAVSSTCIFSLRALGHNKISMLVSLATMSVNALCNYLLIFGKLGLPALGVAGAAWGTLIARLFEMTFYLVLLARKRTVFSLELGAFRKLRGCVVKTYVRKAIPLIFNELLWSVGLSVFFWSYARLDERSVPAVTIAEQCFQVAAVLAMGTSSAVSVLIGTELGANRLQKAKENCKKLFSLVVMVGAVCTALCVLLGLVMPYAFAVSQELRRMATLLASITALFAPLNFVYGFCFFCLRAGGDTRNAMLLDSGYMWMVPVPASILMAVLLPGRISIVAAMLVVQFLMNAKVALALQVLRKGRWVRNITLENPPEPQEC
ncbi:MAG: MATE family efflux transporter [Candidatus Limiplasma sp.]|nr:MATE family efflux transporter [Candidatus Limiplasma sp.]